MSVKAKGSNAERELLHMFWSKGWACLRSAGSGSMKYPGPDLLVGNKVRRMSIECKTTTKNKVYLNQHDMEKLREFSNVFDARPLFAVKFQKSQWLFLNLEDIGKTPKGFVIDEKVAQLRGVSFEELISY
jgi:holliday junction resolvase Hjr